MLTKIVVLLVDACRRYALAVVLLSVVACGFMGNYVATHFRMNTDIDQLMANDLDWRVREREFDQAFPQSGKRLVILVDGSDADVAENAASVLVAEMQKRPELFKNVVRPDNIPFFRKNGLLYLSKTEIGDMLDMMIQGQPLLGAIASDPSLRGLFGTLNLVLLGLQQEQFDYGKIAEPFDKLAATIESAVAGQDKPLPLRSMVGGKEPTRRDLRKIILTQPVLDYADLSPGKKASDASRQIAADKNLTPDNGVRVRLTGSVALNDEEFASVADGAATATILSIVLVVVILFLALRSIRLIIPILLTLTAGLIATTAFAMAFIGSLNLMSVAFAVMFVGIAVDFGIQFGVRYRDQRHQEPDNVKAMQATARTIASPLFLAAVATSVGFIAFLPTDYRGVAELGLIAGVGMVIAFALNITLLPALVSLFRPSAEPEGVGYAWAAPADVFLTKHRKGVLWATAVVTLVALGISTQVRFDFDPLNLKDANTESVSTLFDLTSDPDANMYTAAVLAPNLEAGRSLAEKLEKLPEVDHVMTLASFVPEDQDEKLAMIADANMLLAPTLNPVSVATVPTDDDVIETIQKTIKALNELTPTHPETTRLAAALQSVVDHREEGLLQRLHHTLVGGVVSQLELVRDVLSVEPVTIDSITDDLRRDWITPNGRAKVEIYPKGNARDHKVLEAFSRAVTEVAPEATGTAISIQESGKTVVNAFIKAGISAIFAIAFLSWSVLRRFSDVARLLAPLLLAGILTLATMVLIRLPLNFANIIALPLLLSLGVSYAIYFVSFWRSGLTNPLQSSMARAVLFSAGTTLVAFGTLSISSHPGTSGMGKLLTIALLYCLLCTFFVLPPLLGRPKSGYK